MTRELWERYIKGEYTPNEKDDVDVCEIGSSFNFPGDNQNYQIRVFNDDGNYPHFHIMNENGFDCSIRMDSPRYNDDSKNSLNKDQINTVLEKLSSTNEVDGLFSKNLWNILKISYYGCNPDIDIIAEDIPDYSKLMEE